nr:AMP-binding protein [Chloroflexota bacterium]
VIEPDGWYHTGDIGRFDERGNLSLIGRKRNIIVLPNGFNVYPEDIENALADEGIGESVVMETSPGRIEAVVLPVGSLPIVSANTPVPERPTDAAGTARMEADMEARVRAANARLSQHGRIDAWRIWPEPDFPRTHTLKVKRDEVRRWAGVDVPLALRDG